MKEHRRYPRQDSALWVELSHPGMGRIQVQARNLSDGGMAVAMAGHVAPPIGAVVQVRIKRHAGAINADPVPMRVMHVQADGTVGLMFV